MSDHTLAFAGMLQASELVRQVATSGNCSQHAAQASIGSIFVLDPRSGADVYDGVGGVRMGLRLAVALFSGQHGQDALQTLNYAMGLGKLGVRMRRDRSRQAELGREIALIAPAWREADEPLEPGVIAQLADAYQRHVSSLDFRITVNGKPDFLKQDDKIALIRSLLLAGLRSAFLWHQTGGRQWRLVFQRKRLLREAESLLAA